MQRVTVEHRDTL